MNSSPDNNNKENKCAVDGILNGETLETNKNKPLDNRKLIANEKFDKIGHLPIQNLGGNKEIHESVEKIPVLDLLTNNYQNELNFTDYHRPCNCTKSYCLKLYCECFARDKLCLNCNCNNCMNNIGHEKSRSTALLRILDKNPLAFLPKIGSGQGHKLHRKGCNCKRSECLKNYCECREAKIECSLLCRCQGCKNRSNELSSYSSQPPCSLDMAILDSNGFKNSNLFKSNQIIDSEKPSENTANDLNYPFANIYDDSNMGQQNMYCAEAPLPDYGPSVNYPPANSNIEDLLKLNESYKKLNENFYKRSSQQTPSQNDNLLADSKQSHLMNWSGYMNVNQDNTDFKSLTNHTAYNLLNYSKYPTHRRIQNTYPLSFSSDLDENSNRMPPPNAFQYFNDNDEYLDIPPVNHFKSFNPIPNMKRFDGNRHYQYPVHLNSGQGLNVHSSDKCEQNDIAEVTSTNEMDPNTMLVSSNCEGVPQHSVLPDNSIIKPSSCDSHSPLSLTTNDNYNCYSFTADSVYPSNIKPKFALKYNTQPQALNGHVLPSLFHNDCDSLEMNSRMSYFRHGNINQSQNISSNRNSPSILHRKSSHLQMEEKSASRYSSNSNFINNAANSNFFNFYNESGSTFTYPNVSIENEELLQKSDLVTNSNLNNQPMYSEHFNPFFYGSKNDIYSKVTCSSNPH